MHIRLFRRTARPPELRGLPPQLLRDIGLPPCPSRPPYRYDHRW
ncbi:hypothetical protein [Mameliella sp. CS4]|nr:hypothetical protein [Mameliella sp. CS4]